MISFKDGNLSIKYDSVSVAKLIFEILFVFNIFAIFISMKYQIASVATIMLFASSMYLLVAKHTERIQIPIIAIWYTAFITFVLLSCTWSNEFRTVYFNSIIRLLIILITMIAVTIYVDDTEDQEKLMSLFIIGILLIISYELINTPFDRWFAGYLGSYASGSNSNDISFWCVCAEMMAFYKAYAKNKYIMYPVTVFLLAFIILSASRKALAIGIIAPVLLIILSTYKKRYFLRIVLICALAVGILVLVMTNETLYSIIGHRIASMFEFFSEDATKETDNSLYLRRYYVQVAEEMFKRSPIVGNGFTSFSKEIGMNYYYYCHNNYWQLLCEFGIVGFVLYYSFYVFCLVKLLKRVFINRSRMCFVFLTFIVLLMIFEVGIVSITSKFCQFVITLAFTATYTGVDDGRKYRYLWRNNISPEGE